MQTRTLGNSDLEITRIGFGAWAVGGAGYQFGWGEQDDAQSIAAIHRSLEHGVNWIDTAAVYGLGHSEEVVARALDGWTGTRPHVFTKCGLAWNAQGEVHNDVSGASIRRECENSLRRLRVEAIDLYQIHWPTGDIAEIDEAWSTMEQLRQEGKVRWIGVSNFDVAELKRAQAIAPVTSLQPPFSLIRRDTADEILPYCKHENIGVIVYSPMYSGLLAGKMTPERVQSLPSDDWRSRSRQFQEPLLSRNLLLVDRLRAIGEQAGHAVGEVAIAWTLRFSGVTAAIVGGRTAAQVDGIVGAAGYELSEEDMLELNDFVVEHDIGSGSAGGDEES